MLDEQSATSEVLKIISSSPSDLQPVFNAMLESATRVCQAHHGTLYLCEADGFRVSALHNMTAAYAAARQAEPVLRPPPGTPLGDVARTRQVAHFPDLCAAQAYIDRHPFIVSAVERGGYRTAACVPMLKDGHLIGAITIARTEVRPFTAKQIELVQTFAAQAVIAIENTQLLNELRQRTDNLAESLEQQTATSEVLKVISDSPGELDPVFAAILKSATRICAAKFAILTLADGDAQRLATSYNVPPPFEEVMRRGPMRPNPSITLGRAIATKQPAQTIDITIEEPCTRGDPLSVAAAKLGSYRTVLAVPMLKDNELMCTLVIFRQDVEAFNEKQIALLSNFAAQAVIAIENARLLSELRGSLQQQTATADVLKVISRSAFDLQTVLNTLTASASRLCMADKGVIFLRDGGVFRFRANFGFSPEAEGYAAAHPLPVGRGSTTGRAAMEGRTIHVPDVLADPEYRATGYQKAFGHRTNLGVPLLRERASIGIFVLTRDEVNPFTDKQIELVDFRRPSYRHRERPAVRRGAEAHRRSCRIVAAADRDGRRAQGHQPVDLRPALGA